MAEYLIFHDRDNPWQFTVYVPFSQMDEFETACKKAGWRFARFTDKQDGN